MEWAALALIGSSLLLLLHCYGTVLLPFVPDESLFLQAAHNLANGNGMGTPALDDLLPGIAQRTYWQPPVYFLALAAWGSMTGFDVVAARWLSRLCAVGVLALLWLLARQWGLGRWAGLLCVLWTASDLAFQYNANIARMDMLSALGLTACLLAFTLYQRDGKEWQVALAGVCGALATLTHFITLPAVAVLGMVLCRRRRWRASVWFALPIAIGWLLWLTYAAQDWHGWSGQLAAQFIRKGASGLTPMALRLLFLHSAMPLWGVFKTNALPLGSILLVGSLVAAWRRNPLFSRWQIAALFATYTAAAIGGEFWYVGWWTPFGYLLLGRWLHAVDARWKPKVGLVVFCAALVGWQAVTVAQTLTSVPRLRDDVARFFAEVSSVLPKGATVVLHSVPDPFPVLQRVRPDLHLVQLSPTPMLPAALAHNFQRAQAFVGVTEWVKGRPGASLPPAQKAWRFHATEGTWVVHLHPL